MGGNICTGLFINFQLVNIKEKNNFSFQLKSEQIDHRVFQYIFKQIFGNNYELKQRYKNLITYISENPNKIFVDSNFNNINNKHTSKLYHYQRRHMCLVDQKNKNGYQIFQQNQVQFTYLSVVLYFLCQNKQLLINRILVTNKLNKSHLYCVKFLSNGQDQYIIVDDTIPTNPKDQILYSQPKAKQIWPLIIQKAWCKLINGYTKAHGLSPLECLQEITGVPSKAIRISQAQIDNILQLLHTIQNSNTWLSVIARKDIKQLQQGQVFAINQIQGDNIYVTSPYHKNNQNNQQKVIRFSFKSFFQSFQYLVVGYYKKGYEPYSYKMRSQKGLEKLYEIKIKKGQQISIRFVQFYKQYMQNIQQNQQKPSKGYQYSPLAIFQLYDHNGNLVIFCQGCQNLHVGAHSVYFTKNINHFLESGKYYLRIEVHWLHQEILKQGNLVIYASFNNVQIKELSYLDQVQKMQLLNMTTLNLPNSVIIASQHQPFKVTYLKKRYNILFSIENVSEQKLILELDFHGSYNFKIKQIQIQNNKKFILKLGSKQLRIFQIMPDQLRPASNIQMCTIRRLPTILQ